MIWSIISITEMLLFVMVAYTVLYLTVFAIASLFYSKFEAPRSRRKARFLVLIPAHAADDMYEDTLKSLESQDYDRKNYDLLVVSHQNRPLTNMKLAQHNLSLQIMPDDMDYTDVSSWQFGIQHCPALRLYDMVVILEAGETVETSYLSDINEAYQLGAKAIQTHRSTHQLDTPRAIMAATFEDINSSIFRMGHVAMGMASGLLGSGMAFEYRWFKDNIGKLAPMSDLKDFEAMVLQDGKYVDFLDDTFFYNKPIQFRGGIHTNERSGWMYSQWRALRRHIRKLPTALFQHNYDLADKILQWTLMPRVVMMAIIGLMCLITPLLYWSMSLKWLITGFWVLFIFAVATPDYLINRRWELAYLHAPWLMLQTLFYALPSGWLLVFARNHKDEWQDDVKKHTNKLKQQGEHLVQQGSKLLNINNKDNEKESADLNDEKEA